MTLGPLGTVAQAPTARLATTQTAIAFFMASVLSWRNLDPWLRTRLNARVVTLRARTVIPVPLGRGGLGWLLRLDGYLLLRLLHVDRRLLHDHGRRRVRVIRRGGVPVQ